MQNNLLPNACHVQLAHTSQPVKLEYQAQTCGSVIQGGVEISDVQNWHEVKMVISK